MLDLLDFILLRRGVPADDRTLSFRRIDGNPQSSVIYFLPWNTPFGVARQAGFTPLDFLAAYEMPRALVSSDPEMSVQAIRGLVEDAQALLESKGIAPHTVLLVGLSVGSFAATYLANRIGARLCAVAPSDRADMMMWQSPATRIVKRRAIEKGLQLAHYSRAMTGYHPIHNLAGVAPNSMFVMGRKDPFVPSQRRARLAARHRAAPALGQDRQAGCGPLPHAAAERAPPARHAGTGAGALALAGAHAGRTAVRAGRTWPRPAKGRRAGSGSEHLGRTGLASASERAIAQTLSGTRCLQDCSPPEFQIFLRSLAHAVLGGRAGVLRGIACSPSAMRASTTSERSVGSPPPMFSSAATERERASSSQAFENRQLFIAIETAVLNDLARTLVITRRVVHGLCSKAQ